MSNKKQEEELSQIFEPFSDAEALSEESEKESTNKLLRAFKEGLLEEKDIENFIRYSTPEEVERIKTLAHYENKNEKLEREVKSYARSHRSYLIIPMLCGLVTSALLYFSSQNEQVMNFANELYNKHIIRAMFYGLIVYMVTTVLLYGTLDKIKIFDLVSIDMLYEKDFNSAFSRVFYKYFDFCNPEEDGMTALELKKTLLEVYDYDADYGRCLEFLESEPNIKKRKKKRTGETIFGVRLSFQKKEENF